MAHESQAALERVEALYSAEVELVDGADLHLEWFEVRVGERGAPRTARTRVEFPPPREDDR
jgi:hypothetical protein